MGAGVDFVQTWTAEQRNIEHSLGFSCFFSVSLKKKHDPQAFSPRNPISMIIAEYLPFVTQT